MGDPTAEFADARPSLLGVAYRMLGSVAEAEDVVQEAWLRWERTDHVDVRAPRAFLTQVVTRLCLDVLGSARARRESYVGPWLPEPPVGQRFGQEHDVTVALMLALERLSALERAAFLLHDVFGLSFDEIAETLDRTPATCRQLASRARRNVRASRPRFDVPGDQAREIASAFFDASRQGDLHRLQELLARDAVLTSDGGGNALAALNPIRGADRVARFFAGLARKRAGTQIEVLYDGPVDGLPARVTVGPDGVLQVTSVEVAHGRIQAIYTVRNPEKLQHVARLFQTRGEAG